MRISWCFRARVTNWKALGIPVYPKVSYRFGDIYRKETIRGFESIALADSHSSLIQTVTEVDGIA
jgi:hypothetical protein